MEKKSIYQALADAQKLFKPALKDSTNPHFRSNYAGLTSIWNACKEGLAENGLFVSQIPERQNEGWVLITKIYNGEGEHIGCTIPILAKSANDSQAFGSAMSYARRYSLSGILGIITDDDDAEDAVRPPQQEVKKASPPPARPQEQSVKKELIELTATSPQFASIVTGLTSGYTMEKVRTKYRVSAEVEKLLLEAVKVEKETAAGYQDYFPS